MQNKIKEKLIIPISLLLVVKIALLIHTNYTEFIGNLWMGSNLENMPLFSSLIILLIYNALFYFVMNEKNRNEKSIQSVKMAGVIVIIITFVHYLYQAMLLWRWMYINLQSVYLNVVYEWKFYVYIYLITLTAIPILTIGYFIINFKMCKGDLEAAKEDKQIKKGDLILTILFVLYLVIEIISVIWMW